MIKEFTYMSQASYLWLAIAAIIFGFILLWLFVFSKKEDFEKQAHMVYNDDAEKPNIPQNDTHN